MINSRFYTIKNFDYNTVIVAFIFISASYFFKLSYVSRQMGILMNLIGAIVVISMIVFYHTFYPKKIKTIPMHYKTHINLLLFSVLLSMPMAKIFHGQNYATTLFAQKFTYFFLLYFYLHYIRLSPKYLINLIVLLGVIWCILYLIQYRIYPTKILNSRIHLDRGTVRIFFPGKGFAIITFFYLMHKTLTEKLKFWNILYLIIFIVIAGVLQGTRSNLGATMMLTGFFVLFYKKVKSRLLIIVLSILIGTGVVLIFSDIFTEMLLVSEKQVDNLEEKDPIRKRAFHFFMNDFQKSPATYIFGNGYSHGSSSYGREIAYYKAEYGFYQSDIGLAGEFSIFGSFFILIELIVLLGGIFKKKPLPIGYARYIFAFILISGLLGSGPFSSCSNIVAIVSILYLIDFYTYTSTSNPVESAQANFP